MSKQVILINGSGGVGKDTFVSYCGLYCIVYNVSTVDRVKTAAKLLGWDGGKGEKDRKFLSDLKLLAVDYSDHSYKYIVWQIQQFMSPECDSQIMFIHVREPQELMRFKNMFDCHTLLVRNKNVEQIMSNMADSNVENFDYDFIINNDEGLGELVEKAREFVFELIHKEVYND